MKAALISYHSPDVDDLESWEPEQSDCFGFLLEVEIGMRFGKGADVFQFMVCTPRWLEKNYKKEKVVSLRGFIVVFRYDLYEIVSWIDNLIDKATGDDWMSIATWIGRYGLWEFEDHDTQPVLFPG